MKNPRRAYRADGTEIEPLTVGSHLAAGFRLVEVWCEACHRHAEIDVSALPPELPVPDIALRAVCSHCGSRQATSRPSVGEFYAKARGGAR